MNLINTVEERVAVTATGIVQAASDVVADNQRELADMNEVVTTITANVDTQVAAAAASVESRVSELSTELAQSFEDLRTEIEENVIDRVEELSAVAEDVDTLMDTFDNTAFLDHSKPVYRWGVWSSYNQWQGWYGHGGHGDAAMFGGVQPQRWGDSNARAWHLNGDKNVLRGLFNKRGYMGWQGTIWNEEWFSHSSTNSKHAGALFRVRNKNSNNINWHINFYYSSYSGWSERASCTINGHSTWESGGNYCGSRCDAGVNFNIPGNRISTVILISASSPRSSGCCDFGPRGNFLAIRGNSLQLPNGLEYVDDMDYAQGGWER
jgi:hypothetical protein